jgi:hypothetical protein
MYEFNFKRSKSANISGKFMKKFKLRKSNKIGYLGKWEAKLACRALAALWVRIQTSLKNTKMGDTHIGKGVANTL